MVVLRPLEFADCLSDSPWFRQNLHEHESVLEDVHKNIKNIEAQCRELIQCTKKLSTAQRAFAKSLKEFRFITIGSTQTDDERKIAECLKKFADFITQIEDHREKILEDSETHYIDPLRKFRVNCIGKVLHEDKKKYEKESGRFYAALEKHLHLSTARKNDFKEADAHLDMQQRNFCKCSLEYVTAIQSVQERMKFEFVETISSFLYSWLTFYHVGHVTHEDFKPFLSELQSKVQKAKQSFDETKGYYENLKEKILAVHLRNAVFLSSEPKVVSSEAPPRSVSSIKQGYVFVQEKSKIPKTIGRDVLSNRWSKYYCVYQKETRIFTMIMMNSSARTDMKGALDQSVSFKLKSCTRRASDSIDKRFCFDVLAMDRTDPITLQALSEEDRRQWLDAMDGREPIYSPGTGPPSNSFGTTLDEVGFDFVRRCLEAIEAKGIKEQGLYRNCGVTSKVQKLVQIGLDKRRTSSEKLSFCDDTEWETKTVSSAVKTFLRNLPEPLMTFDLHVQFINAAKMHSAMRVSHIHYYVHQLPKIHMDMLKLIIEHLRKVANHSDENLMTVGNLGVCFGPTLLRPKEETMAAIMDIKFCNVVVEVLIANNDLIFNTCPSNIDGVPCPPKPVHHDDLTTNSFLYLDEGSSNCDSSPSAIANRSETAIISPMRPHSITARKPVSGPRIYDRVSSSFIDYADEASVSSPPRSIISKPSTSMNVASIPSFTSKSHQGSVPSKVPNMSPTRKLSKQTDNECSVSTFESRSSWLRRAGEVPGNSSDSLNSAASGSDESSSPGIQSRRLVDSSYDDNATTLSKSKLGTSYALAYNPYTCESIRPGKNMVQPGDCMNESSLILRNTTQLSGITNMNIMRCSPILSYVDPLGSLQPGRRVKTLYGCTAGHGTELSFQPGQIITNVYESKEEGWLVGTLNGKTGLIPANYVESLP